MLGYNVSIAVWVGLAALESVGAERGAFMLLDVDAACEQPGKEGLRR